MSSSPQSRMPVALRYVPTEDIEYWWPLIEPILQRAVDRVETGLTVAEIRERAEADTMRLWVIESDGRVCASAATCEIRFKAGNIVHITALAGDDMDEWLGPGLAEFERLAKLNGMIGVRLCGRPGWQRVMPGYRVEMVTLEKRFDG